MILVLAFLASGVTAAPVPQPYDIGWFANAEGTVSELFVGQLVPFEAHAVLFDVEDEIAWFQLGIGLPNASVFVLSRSFFGPAPSDTGTGEVDFVVSTGGCVSPEPRQPLVVLQLLSVVPVASDTIIEMRGRHVEGFGDVEPGLRTCAGDFHVLSRSSGCRDQYPGGALILNPTLPCQIVGTDAASFTAIKSRFD